VKKQTLVTQTCIICVAGNRGAGAAIIADKDDTKDLEFIHITVERIRYVSLTCLFERMYICMHTSIYTHIHTYLYIYIYIYTYIDCAEILSLCTLQFKILKGEIYKCGIRLIGKYKELRACATCSGPKNLVNKLICLNCKLVHLKGIWKEVGFCQPCDAGIKKRDAAAKMGA